MFGTSGYNEYLLTKNMIIKRAKRSIAMFEKAMATTTDAGMIEAGAKFIAAFREDIEKAKAMRFRAGEW